MCTVANPPPGPNLSDSSSNAGGWEDVVLHDLRTPLAVVRGQAQLIQRRLRKDRNSQVDQAADLERRIEHIVRSATRIQAMLDELQLLVGGIAPPLRRECVDLIELTRGVIADVCLSRPRVRIRLRAPALPLTGCWDVGRLERALANLIGNASKYSHDGDEVVVALWCDVATTSPAAVVVVRDNGVGIPAADLPRVFDPFFRAANVPNSVDGLGLGLASVRQTVEQHGGSISVSSREGHGTTFTLRLPRAVPD